VKDTNISVNSETGRATIEIMNFVGSKTMNTYMGTFECRCLLPAGEYVKSNRDFVSMVGVSPDNDATRIAYALIQLKYRLIKKAPFWISEGDIMDGSHIEDYNLIMHLHKACMEAEKTYKDMMKDQFDKNKDRLAKQRTAIAERVKDKEPDQEDDAE
jgi:hypothetical protein